VYFYNRMKSLLVAILFTVLCITSCKKDSFITSGNAALSTSIDTLHFDTVFTSVGSITQLFRIYNENNQKLRLSTVSLSGGASSYFKINVDGTSGPAVNNIEIEANDSIYVFVSVKIDPSMADLPFVVEDSIRIRFNGKDRWVQLQAWGQNANYIPSSEGKGGGALLSCSFGSRTWDDPKPYVIYGILYVDSCQLILPPGTKIYVHGGVVRNENSIYNDGLLVFYKNGRLISQGTIENPVIIQGDRLEEEYKDIKSQWVGLLFWHESKKNELRNTIIKNSIIGIRADSLAEVSMYGCQISNTGGPAVIGRHGKIYGENCLFYDNSTYGVQLTYGGDYEFNYCTIANYEGQDESVILTDFYCEDILCSTGVRLNNLKAMFSNCIFAGSGQDEIGLSQVSEDDNNFVYHFSHCAVRVDELLEPENTPDFFDHCDNCINLKSNDKLFLNQNENDYRLDTMSVALNKGKTLPMITTDILGKIRKPVPDIGCYEF